MAATERGRIYHCNVCGAELMVVGRKPGDFEPICCNQPMVKTPRQAEFYVCTICGSELAVLRPGEGEFRPRCCDKDMLHEAA